MIDRFRDDVDARQVMVRMCYRAAIVCYLNAHEQRRSLVGMLEEEGFSERQIADALVRLHGAA